MLFECPKCGWCHFGQTKEDVDRWEAEWKVLFETKSKEWLAAYGITDTPPSRQNGPYGRCACCGNPDTASFFESKKTLYGHTIQPFEMNREQEALNEQRKRERASEQHATIPAAGSSPGGETENRH